MKVSKPQSTKTTCPAGTGTFSPATEEGNAMPAKPKNSKLLQLCTENVRTTLAPGSQNLLAETLRAHSINIACLQQTLIPDEGHTSLSARNPEPKFCLCSDHRSVMGTIYAKLNKKESSKRFHVEMLNWKFQRSSCQSKLRNKLEEIPDSNDLNNIWGSMKQAILKAAANTIGYTHHA